MNEKQKQEAIDLILNESGLSFTAIGLLLWQLNRGKDNFASIEEIIQYGIKPYTLRRIHKELRKTRYAVSCGGYKYYYTPIIAKNE